MQMKLVMSVGVFKVANNKKINFFAFMYSNFRVEFVVWTNVSVEGSRRSNLICLGYQNSVVNPKNVKTQLIFFFEMKSNFNATSEI